MMKHTFVFIFFCVGVSCLVTGLPSKAVLSRERRNFAELKTIEYATRIALQERFRNCIQIGCGLIDIVASGKKKRDSPNQLSDSYRNYLLSKIIESAKDRS